MHFLPQLLVDLRVVRSNFIQLWDKLNLLSIDLRPHVKTIHDPQIAMPLFNEGLKNMCVKYSNVGRFFNCRVARYLLSIAGAFDRP